MTMNFQPCPAEAFSDEFELWLDRACQETNAKQTHRSYLGGSRLGVECERALGFEFHHEPKDMGREFSGKIVRVFDRGHDNEIRAAEYLRAAGFTVLTERADGKQFGFYVAKDKDGVARIAGHCDGIITAAPHWFLAKGGKVPCLWENKCLSNKSWNDTKKKGVKVSKPVYYAQMQIYQAYLEITETPALFTAFNGDTAEVYAELVPFDHTTAQTCSDRGARVVQSSMPEDLPRIAKDAADFRCKFCDWRQRCWLSLPSNASDAYETPQATWGGFGTK